MATRMTGAERREQLLDATKAIVVADGFHAVSIEAVARAAGITRPIVYGHFRDLGGLLEALVERESRRALSQLPETYDDLLAALTAYLGAVKSDPDTWRLVLMPAEVREYVLIHELMHLREMNHSARFWARVEEVCPGWRDAEHWLKRNGSLVGL